MFLNLGTANRKVGGESWGGGGVRNSEATRNFFWRNPLNDFFFFWEMVSGQMVNAGIFFLSYPVLTVHEILRFREMFPSMNFIFFLLPKLPLPPPDPQLLLIVIP